MLGIEKETPSQLVLKESEWIGIGGALFFVVIGLYVFFTTPLFEEGSLWWVGVIFVLAGIGVFLSVDIERRVILDKLAGKLSMSKKKVISKKTEDYDFADIEGIELEQYYRTPRPGESRITKLAFRIFVVTKDKQKILLTRYSKDVGMRTGEKGPERQMAKRIAEFIGVPFKEGRPLTEKERLSVKVKEEMEKG